jgi:hypothetical protein
VTGGQEAAPTWRLGLRKMAAAVRVTAVTSQRQDSPGRHRGGGFECHPRGPGGVIKQDLTPPPPPPSKAPPLARLALGLLSVGVPTNTSQLDTLSSVTAAFHDRAALSASSRSLALLACLLLHRSSWLCCPCSICLGTSALLPRDHHPLGSLAAVLLTLLSTSHHCHY